MACVPAGAAVRSPRSAQAAQARPAVAGLGQSWTSGREAWAVVAVGHLGKKLETFWQILARPTGARDWRVVTPPGVASNGGFSVEGAQRARGGAGSVIAGFQPSQYLRYSPIALTDDEGKTWTAGTLGSGLLPVADAVAVEPDGTALALVRARGGTVLESDGSLTRWKVLITRRALDATGAARSCRVLDLSALAAPSESGPASTAALGSGAASAGPVSPELGTACAVPGVVGLFHRSSNGWEATRVRVTSRARSTFTVLRLEARSSGTWALVEGRSPRATSLVALWRAGPAASWRASPQVRLHGSVLSTAALGGSSLLVVTGSPFRAQGLLWIGGPGTRWRSLGRPPAGTQAIVPAPGPAAVAPTGSPSAAPPAVGPGLLSALVVSGSEVTVWQRGRTGRWGPTAQRLHVPVEYGSST